MDKGGDGSEDASAADYANLVKELDEAQLRNAVRRCACECVCAFVCCFGMLWGISQLMRLTMLFGVSGIPPALIYAPGA